MSPVSAVAGNVAVTAALLVSTKYPLPDSELKLDVFGVVSQLIPPDASLTTPDDLFYITPDKTESG